MSFSRRHVLSILGGGTIIAAGAIAGFATTRTPHDALKPWKLAGRYDDPRKNALSFALLAPSPHNRQPWFIDLSTPDLVRIFLDPERNLPATDPCQRQLIIGMGCFLEQMVIAASAAGFAIDLSLYPEGETGPVAEARFQEGGVPDPLFAQTLARRSCKEPYEMQPVPDEMVQALQPFASSVIAEPETVAEIRALTWDAWMVEATTPAAWQESIDLMRLGKREINANPDGIDLGGPVMDALILIGIMSREASADPTSTAYRQAVGMYRTMLEATPAYAVINTAGNDRAAQIAAGRQWLRLNLKTTELGLSIHPISQTLQEFPSMKPHYEKAHLLLAREGETVQMLGRLGFGPQVPKTPRWPLDTRILNG